VAQQETLTLIRARDVLVRLRTGAVNSVRGLEKPCGVSPASLFHPLFCEAMPSRTPARSGSSDLGPLLLQIADMTVKIKQYDRAIKERTTSAYPETQALIKV